MKKAFTFLFLSSILLASCGFSKSEQAINMKESGISLKQGVPAEFFPSDITVVAVGDSLTEGVGDSTGRGGYVPYLKRMLENEKSISTAEIHNFGVKGNRTAQLLDRIESPQVQNEITEADIVVITIGGNDVMKVVRQNFSDLKLQDFEGEKRLYQNRLNQVMGAIKSANPDSTVLLLGLYNPFFKWFADVDELNQVISDWNLASQSILSNYDRAYYVEIDALFREAPENLLYTDYFHPNDRGYERIALRIFETLEEQVLDDQKEKRYTARKEEN